MGGKAQGLAPLIALEAMNRACRFIQTYLGFLWPIVDTILLFGCTCARLGSGISVAKGIDKCQRPDQPLVLYDSQSDPDCRVVRETLSVLDLDFICYPCPKEFLAGDDKPINSRYRIQLVKAGGLLKVPLLIDPSKNVKLYTADHIVPYLWKAYGDQAHQPKNYRMACYPAFRHVSLFVCQLLRPCVDMGVLRAPSHRPEKPLELWGFEGSPYVRRVTEAITTLELPFVMKTTGKGSAKRPQLRKELEQCPQFGKRAPGKVQVPMLKDPNDNNIRMIESAEIVRDLSTRYQTYPVAQDSWLESNGEGPEFSHSAAAMAAVLALVAPPLLAMIYVGAAVFQLI